MSPKVSLRQRTDLGAPPPAPQETPTERRARQLAIMRELAELNLRSARDAANRVEQAEPGTDQADAATLSLARATRAITNIFTVENRIADGEQPPLFQPESPRRAMLREALHPLVKQEPDPVRRNAMRRRLDNAIDDALLADFGEAPAAEIAQVIARSFGLRLDLATVSDELLGFVRNRTPPGHVEGWPVDCSPGLPRAPP